MSQWQPTATLATLQARAKIINSIRQFFQGKGVLEVDTPSLSAATVTDRHLHSFATSFHSPHALTAQTLYLQTSPEYAMKRLLCAGSGPIFQLCKAFRDEEAGRHHNPEFTMLEWYRPGFDHHDLMQEMDELVQLILHCQPAEYCTYQQVFVQHLQLDPLTATLTQLRHCASAQGFADIAANEQDRDTLLQLLFSMRIEPCIGQQRPCFVYDFPASQAALARICQSDPRVAERFELYYQNMELANGFHELADSQEQQRRFMQDNQARAKMGLAAKPIDTHLLAALAHGLPDCAGVAMGVDRLIMLALNKSSIEQVLTFSVNNA